MVAIVAGNGLGLFNTSLNTLGGAMGQGSLGQAGGQALVNAATGNLILQFTDEQLSGLGRDLLQLRTYNTQGALNDADGDGWRWDGERRVVLSGTRNTAGSTLTRTTGDGHEALYTWTGSSYQSSDGDGAHDRLQWDSTTNEWLWTGGTRRTEERYAGDNGRLLSMTDAQGTQIRYGYDASGRLASVKDSSGQELVLVYNAAGKLERLDTRATEGGALTRQVYYSYDASGRLTSVKTDLTPADNSISDGKVYTTSYAYDGASFRIARVTQSDGTSVAFTYQLVGAEYRISSVSDASGTTIFTYDTVNRRTNVANGLGQLWNYTYDAAGQLTEAQSPAENGLSLSTRYAYDGQGNVTRITDGRGQVLSYGYDANGNRILERDASGNTLVRVYSASNQLLNEIRYNLPATWNAATGTWTEPPASAAQATRYAYDAQNRLRYVIDAMGAVTEYSYNASGLRTAERSYTDRAYSVAALTPTATLSESQLNSWAAARDKSKSQLSELIYDYRGNLSRRTTYVTVNASGAGVLDAAATVSEFIYSEHGQLLQSIAVRGASRTAKTTLSSLVYDGMGRVLSQVDASGTRTTAYNGSARSITLTSTAGLTVVQAFDTQGRLISVSESGTGVSRTTQYVYDAAGRLSMTVLGAPVTALTSVTATINGFTNEDWDNGTWRKSAGFSIPASSENIEAFKTGASVTLADGQVRKIVAVYIGSDSMSVMLDGAVLDGDAVGYPNTVSTGIAVTTPETVPGSATATINDFTNEDWLNGTWRKSAGFSIPASSENVAAFKTGALVTLADGQVRKVVAVYMGGDSMSVMLDGAVLDGDAVGHPNTVSTSIAVTVLHTTPLNSFTNENWLNGVWRASPGFSIAGTEANKAAFKVGMSVLLADGQIRKITTIQVVGEHLSIFTDGAVLDGNVVGYPQVLKVISTNGVAAPVSPISIPLQDSNSVRSYTFYDEAGRISAKVDGNGAVTEYGYDAAGNRISEKQYATLVDTSSWFDGIKVTKTLLSQIRPASNAADRSKTYVYDAAGRLTTSTDAAGVVTTYTYDGRGQLIQQQTGDRITRTFYDAAGRQIGQLDGEGYLRENRYNAAGQLIQVIRYSSVTLAANRAAGTLEQLRPAGGETLQSWYFYDGAGRQIGSVDEQQFVTETIFDEAGNTQQTIRYATAYTAAITASTAFSSIKTTVASGAKQVTTTAFDSFGRVNQRTGADGTVTAYEYDSAGRLVRETFAQGTTEERSTRTRFDAAGQVIGQLLGEASARITAGMTEAQVQAIYAQYGLTYTYDSLGRVASVKDAAGNRTASYYDAAGRLTHVINALGEVSETVYSAFGEVSERSQLTNRLSAANTASLTGGLLTTPVKTLVQAIRNAASDNRTTYGYDKRGLLSSSTDALGYLTTYGYNDFAEQTALTRTVTSGTTPVTVTQTFTYNKRGERIGSIEDAAGLARSTVTAYDAFGRIISRTDGRGQLYTTRYESGGRVIVQSNPLNQSQRSEYDAFGRVLKQIDALGQTTTYHYDDSARSLTITTPDGVSVTTVKSRHGQTLTVTDGTGAVTRFGYDKNGQLLSRSDALNQTTTNAYDNAGRLLSTTDALGRITTYGYDAANRVVSRTAADGTVTRYTFDGQGRQVRVVEAEGKAEQRITDYAYDRKGQLLKVTQDPNGLKLTTSYRYDGLGQQVEVARGTVASPNQQVTLYGFDKLGRRISERQDPSGLNLTTQYRYNGNDQVTRKIDAGGNSTWYVYDAAGQLADTVDALGGVTRNTYNNAGQLTSTRRYATALAAATLAALGDAPSSISPTTSSKDWISSFVYDAQGRVRYTIDSLNQVSETVYDAAGRVLENRRYDRSIAASTPRTLSDITAALSTAGVRKTTYVYDANGQLKSTTDAAGKVESYTYDAVGNRKTLTNKNGHVWTYHYDSLNRLVEEVTPTITVASISDTGVVSAASRTLVTQITYDTLGNVVSRTEGIQRASGLADDLSQARTTSYAYDAVGRQIRITSPGWYSKLSGQYLQASDGTANTFQVNTEVTYDALGNAVRNRVRVNNTGTAATDFVDSYKAYDALGRVTHDIDALKGVTAYRYDALGQAISTVRYANGLSLAAPARGYYLPTDITSTTLVPNAAQDRTLLISYDALGRKTAVQQNAVNIYNFTGSVATSTFSKVAPTTLYSYDAFGQLIRETQITRNTSGATVQTGASTVHYYDQLGQRIGSVDALGYYSRMEYDAFGQVIRQTDHATALTSWNESTLPTAPATSTNDRRTRFAYDALGRTTQTVLENARYWQQTINPTTGAVSASLVNGELILSRSTYDGVGNVRTVTDAQGNVVTTDYNALGQAVKVTEPARATAKYGAVDAFAQGTVQAAPITDYLVNAFGQIIREMRRAGTDTTFGVTQTTRTRYDAAGYEIQEIDAAGSAQNYKVDVAGRRLEESRQVSATLTGWTVNGAAKSYNQTLRRTFEYDVLGQQIATRDWYTAVNGSVQNTLDRAVYNRFGEVTEKRLNGNLITRYGYDQAGRLVEQQDTQGITRFDYDITGKISRSNQVGDTTTAADDRVTYLRNDLLGRAYEQHLPAFEANINADTLNNVTLTLTTPIIRQSYDRWGNLLSRTDARGYVTTYTYNHANQILTETLPVTDILRENGTSYRASLIHEKRYDGLGRLIQEVDLVGPYTGVTTSTALRTRQHVYNEAGQLTRDIDALGYSRHYRYDSHGNRVATQDALGTVLVDGYDLMNRQINHGIIRNGAKVTLLTNQYDQAGRLYGEINGTSAIEETLKSTANTNWTSTTTGVAGNVRYTLFDERNNIVKTRNESKIEKSTEYDADNRKVKETDALGNTLTWTYDAANWGRLSDRKDLGNQEYSYTYNDFGQVAKESIGIIQFSYAQPDRYYTYYGNGMIKTIMQGYDKRNAAGTIIEEITNTSTFTYDTSGNRVREVNSARRYLREGVVSESLWGGEFVDVKNSAANYNGMTETRYKYDETNRLKEIKSPAGSYLFGGESKAVLDFRGTGLGDGVFGHIFALATNTARIDSLLYNYDELGNRRRVYLDTTNQSGARKIIDDWYKYDLEGRVLVTEGYKNAGGQVVAGKLGTVGKGQALSYDAVGRRLSSEQWQKTTSPSEFYQRSDYAYNDLGQVLSASTRQVTRALNADTTQAATSVAAAKLLFTSSYDNRGNRLTQTDYTNGVASKLNRYSYRGDAQAASQLTYNIVSGVQKLSQASYLNETGMFDAAGNQQSYRYVIYKTDGSINYRGNNTKTYALYEGYKEASITATISISSTPGKTNLWYNGRGELQQVNTSGNTTSTHFFASNHEGQLLGRADGNGTKSQIHVFYQGAAIASVGNLSTPQITDTFTPISTEYPGRTPGSYVVNEGDTLASIAQSVWGDSKMWYLIADANGLDLSLPLTPGNSLKIPNVVSSTHNDATTFKPYNPDEIIGNTTPTAKPIPPKPKKKKCGGIASVVMVVVAVVATVFTAGAAALALAPAGTFAAGTTIAAAGTAALTGGVAGFAGVGAAVIGGAVGSAASQLAGKAMGVVDDFSWRQVAVGGLTAGFASGLGGLAKAGELGSLVQRAASTAKYSYTAQGVFSYASSQVANRVAGLTTSFNWSNLAASVVGANIGGYVNGAIGTQGLVGATVRGQISAHASAAIQDKWFGGSRPSYGQIAADAFGNTLASYSVSQIAPRATITQLDPNAPLVASTNGDPSSYLGTSYSTQGIEVHPLMTITAPRMSAFELMYAPFAELFDLPDELLIRLKEGMDDLRNLSRENIYNSSSSAEAAFNSGVYAINSLTATVVGGLADAGRLITSSEQRSEFAAGVYNLVTTNPTVTAQNVASAWSGLPSEDKLLGAGSVLVGGAGALKLGKTVVGQTVAGARVSGVPDSVGTLSTRERVLANISKSRAARQSSNLGGGLNTDLVPLNNNSTKRLLQNRGLPNSVVNDVSGSFDGQIFGRHGLAGDSFTITETADGMASGIFVTRGSAGATPEIRRQVLALPPSNLATVENFVQLARPQILLEGRVAPQVELFGDYATGGGWQVVTDGGIRSGALIRNQL